MVQKGQITKYNIYLYFNKNIFKMSTMVQYHTILKNALTSALQDVNFSRASSRSRSLILEFLSLFQG